MSVPSSQRRMGTTVAVSGRGPAARHGRAGAPTTVTPGGTSSTTTAPAPTWAPAPIRTGPMTFAPVPMWASRSIVAPARFPARSPIVTNGASTAPDRSQPSRRSRPGRGRYRRPGHDDRVADRDLRDHDREPMCEPRQDRDAEGLKTCLGAIQSLRQERIADPREPHDLPGRVEPASETRGVRRGSSAVICASAGRAREGAGDGSESRATAPRVSHPRLLRPAESSGSPHPIGLDPVANGVCRCVWTRRYRGTSSLVPEPRPCSSAVACFHREAAISSLCFLLDGDEQPVERARDAAARPVSRAAPASTRARSGGAATRLAPEDPELHSYRSGFWGTRADPGPRAGRGVTIALAHELVGERRRKRDARLASISDSGAARTAGGAPVRAIPASRPRGRDLHGHPQPAAELLAGAARLDPRPDPPATGCADQRRLLERRALDALARTRRRRPALRRCRARRGGSASTATSSAR